MSILQRIFACDCSYKATHFDDDDDQAEDERSYAHVPQLVSRQDWSLLLDRVLNPSWDRSCRLGLDPSP